MRKGRFDTNGILVMVVAFLTTILFVIIICVILYFNGVFSGLLSGSHSTKSTKAEQKTEQGSEQKSEKKTKDKTSLFEEPEPEDTVENEKDDEEGDEDESVKVDDSVWQEKFKRRLSDTVSANAVATDAVCNYCMYDIDKDDIPEMIIKCGDCEANYHGQVFKYDTKKDDTVLIGDIGMGHTVMYSYPDGNGIIQDIAHMGWQMMSRISIENGELTETKLYEEEIGGDEEYTEVSSIVKGAKYIEEAAPGDVSLITGETVSADKTSSKKDTGIHEYDVFTEDITWNEAYRRCLDRGGYLARIDSDEENDYIGDMLNARKITGIAYIGGRRELDSYAYHWVGDDGKLYDYDVSSGEYAKYWLEGEPSFYDEVNGKRIDECYMSMLFKKSQGRWYWNDVCDDVRALAPDYYTGKISYICEYE